MSQEPDFHEKWITAADLSMERAAYFVENRNPYQVSENEPVVQATIGAVEEVMGSKPQILGKAGCTDASHLFHSGGIPTVIFGPGNEKLAHKADECIEIKNLVSAVPIFISIFHKLLCCSK